MSGGGSALKKHKQNVTMDGIKLLFSRLGGGKKNDVTNFLCRLKPGWCGAGSTDLKEWSIRNVSRRGHREIVLWEFWALFCD